MEIVGAVVGFAGSVVPNVLKHIQDRSDKKHELEILKMQMDFSNQKANTQLKEIGANADLKEAEAIYKTFYNGNKWVDCLNASVRPILAYSFFILYIGIKIFYATSSNGFNIAQLWSSVDNTIFLTIISFFYGHRAMQKFLR